ncbi:MAG: hypothetical protein ACR2PM_16590 [Hyphomicrobiales bacterium]
MTENIKLFMFRSSKKSALHGFATDPSGDRLPEKYGPWAGIGVVRPDQAPPHGMPRDVIESGIAENGYQLWRTKKS